MTDNLPVASTTLHLAKWLLVTHAAKCLPVAPGLLGVLDRSPLLRIFQELHS